MRSITSNFESLHSELLARVCEYLDETHPASLVAFSRVSKTCYFIASSFFLRTIKITVSNGQQLVQDVQKWETLLLRVSGFRHVRRLILHCSAEEEDKRKPCNGYLSLEPCERYEDASGLRTCWDLHNRKVPSTNGDFMTKDGWNITNRDWEAMAHLVGQLTGLVDIFHACPGKFPSSLLQTLHARVPQCRLHDYSFRLNSLDQESIDPYEVTLAGSPCLYSIGELNLASDREAWQYVRRQASRLKEAHVLMQAHEAFNVDDEDAGWRSSGAAMRPTIPPLKVFHLNKTQFPENPLTFSTISWALQSDFSALRVLKLDTAIANLDRLPAPKDFPVLETLVFHCARATRMEYWNTLLTFLHDIPRLTTLQISQWARSVSFVPGLNPHLRYLDFSTRVHGFGEPMKDDHIRRLADCCPHLEELIIEIRRSRGSTDEVSLYRALGRLRRLQYLTLNLDASPSGLDSTVEFLDPNGDLISHGTMIEPWFDAKDAKTLDGPLRPYRQGHVHDVLVNSAIDSDLARSIFEVVNKAKARERGAMLPLERLNIDTFGGQEFQPAGRWSPRVPVMLPFLAALHRKWLVERDVRDNARNVLYVTEMDPESRAEWWNCQARDLMKSENKYLYQDLLDIWQRLWPSDKEGDDWWESWKSLRLQVIVNFEEASEGSPPELKQR